MLLQLSFWRKPNTPRVDLEQFLKVSYGSFLDTAPVGFHEL